MSIAQLPMRQMQHSVLLPDTETSFLTLNQKKVEDFTFKKVGKLIELNNPELQQPIEGPNESYKIALLLTSQQDAAGTISQYSVGEVTS